MNRIAVRDISRTDLEQRYVKIRPFYEKYLAEFSARLLNLLKESGIRFTLKERCKSFDSMFAKILRKAKELGASPDRVKELSRDNSVLITDLIGVRVICPFEEDTVRVEDVIRGSFEVVERERKGEDYSPREFGYEAVHLIVKLASDAEVADDTQKEVLCEVQLRTILQDAWAEVEHELLYKAEFTPFDEPIRRRLAAVNANLSLVDTIFQEIRDYQHRLQEELYKRRETVAEKIQAELSLPDAPRTGKAGDRIMPTDFSVSLVETNDNLLLEALTAHNDKRYTEAIAIYGRLLSRQPKNTLKTIIYLHRGMAYFGSSRYEEAMQDFTSAIQVDKKNIRAYYYRGITFRFMQDYPHALEDFERCVSLDPYQFDAVFARAQIYFSMGDYVMAFEDCAKALTVCPEDERAARFLEVVKDRMRL